VNTEYNFRGFISKLNFSKVIKRMISSLDQFSSKL